jgi:hypothetical protein
MDNQIKSNPTTKLVKEPIVILDYLVLIPLVISILNWRFNWFDFFTTKSMFIYFSFLLFFGYWIIRIVFNEKYKEIISN